MWFCFETIWGFWYSSKWKPWMRSCFIVHQIENVRINTSQIKTINWYTYCIRLCIGHELCQIKYLLLLSFFFFSSARGNSLTETDLHYSFVLFLHDISFIFMPGITILMLGWQACPTWLLSLSIFFHHAGMNIPCEPQSPSLSENEAVI